MKYIVTVNDKNYEVEVEKGVAQVLSVTAAAPVSPAAVHPAAHSAAPAATPVAPPAVHPAPSAPAAAPAAAPSVTVSGGEMPLKAPMPGTILSVMKKPGDPVKKGDVVLILEAMKMENEIVSMADGIVAQVLVNKGSSVATGDPLALIV